LNGRTQNPVSSIKHGILEVENSKKPNHRPLSKPGNSEEFLGADGVTRKLPKGQRLRKEAYALFDRLGK
jgi:hypothetical protein